MHALDAANGSRYYFTHRSKEARMGTLTIPQRRALRDIHAESGGGFKNWAPEGTRIPQKVIRRLVDSGLIECRATGYHITEAGCAAMESP